jgi:predicted RNase H-like nuclease (RuvC/YqgF family)
MSERERSIRYYGTNRYVCDVLREMRACHETHNYSILLSLIEEMQVLVNRMESGLSDVRDIRHLSEEVSKLKNEAKELVKQCDDLDAQIARKKEVLGIKDENGGA